MKKILNEGKQIQYFVLSVFGDKFLHSLKQDLSFNITEALNSFGMYEREVHP
jgi:hypothetical protein